MQIHLMSNNCEKEQDSIISIENSFGIERLPDHVLIEIFIRVAASEWTQVACVKKHWATLFRSDCFWQAALAQIFPLADQAKTWPGPIPRGLTRRYHFSTFLELTTTTIYLYI